MDSLQSGNQDDGNLKSEPTKTKRESELYSQNACLKKKLEIRDRTDEVHGWLTECQDKALQLLNKDMSATQEKDEALEGRSKNVDMGKDNESQQPGELSETSENCRFEHNRKALFRAQLFKYFGVSESTVSRNPSDQLAPTPVELVPGHRVVTVTERVFSENPNSEIVAMCTTSEKRVWIKYKSDGEGERTVLFSKEGQIQKKVNALPGHSIVTVQTNITIGIGVGKSRHWVDPNGDSGTQNSRDYTMTRFAKCGDIHLIANATSKKTECTLFDITFKPNGHKNPAEISSFTGITTPDPGFILDASQSKEHFAILLSEKSGPSTLGLYSKSQSDECKLNFTYSPGDQKKILDACFFRVDGKEMLVVVVEGDNKVHVVDHTKDGSFKGYMYTRNVKLNRPCRLATDHENVMWIGCEGGKAVLLEL